MHPVVSRRHPLIIGQPLLRALELFAADDGRHGCDRDPLGRVRHPPAAPAAAGRPQGGTSPLDGLCAQAVGEDLAEVHGVGQHSAHSRKAPEAAAPWRGDTQAVQAPRQAGDRDPLVCEPGEQVAHHRRLRFVQPNACRVARPLGIKPVAIGRPRPGQQHAGAQLAQTAAAHPLGDQGPLILGHRAADLQQQLVVRIVAHRPVEELDGHAVFLQFLDQEHLVHVVARQPIRRGDQDAVQPSACGGVAQMVKAGTPQTGATVTVVAKDVLLRQLPAACRGMGAQAVELLLNGLRLGLAPGRNPSVGGYLHGGSPTGRPAEWPRERASRGAPRLPAGAADRPCPTAAAPPDRRLAAGKPSTAAASWSTPRKRDPPGTALLALSSIRSAPTRPGRSGRTNRPHRIRQNLPFANRPSWRYRGRSW